MTAAVIVVNPAAGHGRAAVRAAAVERELRHRGIRTESVTTSPLPDDELATVVGGAEVAVAVGGDGTLNRVIAAAVRLQHDRRPRVAFLASGTGNAAARAFGFPRDAARMAQLITDGSTRPVDVGVLSRDGSRVAVFVLWAGAGVDAELIERVAQQRASCRGAKVSARYVIEAARLLFRYDFPEIFLPSLHRRPFGAVMVANVGRLAIGSVTNRADPSDGLLDVIATEPRSRLSWVSSAILSGLRLYDRCPRVSRTSVAAIRIESATRVPVHADGEPAGTLPVEISVMPAAVRLCSAIGQATRWPSR